MLKNEELLAQVYDELRRLAAARIAVERPGQTLQATALVHEAYLRLGPEQSFENRAHFYAAAAEAMRRILVDAARKRTAQKRGGDGQRIAVEPELIAAPEADADEDMLAIHEALEQLAAADPLKAELVKLRYFVGLSIDETAAVLGISASTADRHWKFARAWLKRAMNSA